MSNVLGLEKFGLGKVQLGNIFEEDEKKADSRDTTAGEQQSGGAPTPPAHDEIEFLLAKTYTCPVCDTTFRSRQVKTGRARRLQPDFDLRPRCQDIDVNKYDVTACPKCGYAALNRNFEHITQGQVKLVRQEVSNKFRPSGTVNLNEPLEPYTYQEAIERYQLALFCTVAKKGKTSEKAYILLKLAWLNRGLAEMYEAKGESGSEEYVEAREHEAAYYTEAFDGMVKAVATENFPMCGMDEHTVNILMAGMAYKLEKYDIASKLVSTVIVSRTAPSAAKERAQKLKDEIILKLHNTQ